MSREALQFACTKTYTHAEGLSCCFRQWRAKESHCQYLHGYALQVQIEFRSHNLDHRHWVVNFGECKEIKEWLKLTFDHKTLIAEDDPALDLFINMNLDKKAGKLIQLVVLPHVGMEEFARHIYNWVENWLARKGLTQVSLYKVQLWEHPTNSAIVYNPKLVVNTND
jgi:6-pyruvoyltetrahydropterin/6-carboxytetrahydropterin synthase